MISKLQTKATKAPKTWQDIIRQKLQRNSKRTDKTHKNFGKLFHTSHRIYFNKTVKIRENDKNEGNVEKV